MGERQECIASSMALKAAKKELRTLMKHRLSVLSLISVDIQSSTPFLVQAASTNHFVGSAVFQRVKCFRPYQEAKRIGIYLSMPTGELQTDAIVRHALATGKQVFVPYLYNPSDPPPDTPKSVMDMVDLRDLSDYNSLKRDNWGIPTIGAETIEAREHVLNQESQPLHMIIMPGVAFDIDPDTRFIRRLGHGKGFYDYFLHRYKQIHGSQVEEKGPEIDVLLYGLALEEQFLANGVEAAVPVGEYDNLLHGLIVGDGKIIEGPRAVE